VKQPKIVIIDYGVGNINSVFNALNYLGYKNILVSNEYEQIFKSNAIILPGVGAFAECMRNLKERNLDKILTEAVMEQSKPILGICVGMQLMANSSEEAGYHNGLGWIPGVVRRLQVPPSFSVPHVGWNDIEAVSENSILSRLPKNLNFYFDHSFHYECNEEFSMAQCNYGIKINAAIHRNNIIGVQFHPEKSQNNGLRLFRTFISSIEKC